MYTNICIYIYINIPCITWPSCLPLSDVFIFIFFMYLALLDRAACRWVTFLFLFFLCTLHYLTELLAVEWKRQGFAMQVQQNLHRTSAYVSIRQHTSAYVWNKVQQNLNNASRLNVRAGEIGVHMYLYILYIYMYICMYICMYVCMYIYVCRYMFMYVYIYICIYTHTNTHTHIHTYIHTYIYIYIIP
jgi:hypothetical protein